MLDRYAVVDGLMMCASNWRIFNAEQWAGDLAALLLGYEVVAEAEPEQFGAAIRAHIAEADSAPKVRDIIDRLKQIRAAGSGPKRAATGTGTATTCGECADGWIESQIVERCADGVERRRKPALVACPACRGGASRTELVRSWERLIEDGGGRLVDVEWGAPLLRRAVTGTATATPGFGFTPEPERLDVHRAERERRKKWAAEELEAQQRVDGADPALRELLRRDQADLAQAYDQGRPPRRVRA
jgi:hypothetical protein